MTLSIVLASYNGADTLPVQLEALAKQSWLEPWELIVSDNGSTDASREIVEAHRGRFENLRLVDSSDRRGIAHARNVGARHAIGNGLAFCDQDDEIAPGWLAAMGEALKQHEFVAGRIEFRKLNDRAGDYRGTPQTDGLMYFWRDESFLPFAFGCTLGMKRTLFHAIGGLDESFTQGGDEEDLCWRLQSAGAKLHFVPAAVTHYRCRRSFREIFGQARRYGEADVALYAKWRTRGLDDARSPLRQLASAGRPFARLLPLALRRRDDRARLVWEIGFVVGRARGSVAHRVLLLCK